MRRALATGWLALTGLAGLFVVLSWLLSSQLRHDYSFWQMAKAATADFAIMAPAIKYLRNHPRKAITMPRYVYPCQYPGCNAVYDETIDGNVDSTGAVSNGWCWLPPKYQDEPGTGTHDHIVNVMHRKEITNGQ